MTPAHPFRPTALVLAALAVLSCGAVAPAARAQSRPDGPTDAPLTLDDGAVIPVRLSTELSSRQSEAGDTFTARVDDGRLGRDDVLSDAVVEGVVREATPREGDRPGVLRLAFTRLRLADGRTLSISGSPAGLDDPDLRTRPNGALVGRREPRDRSLTYAGIGAGAAALGDVLGGRKIRPEHVLLGGGLGYAAGQALKGRASVHDVDLRPGTEMGVRLTRNAGFYHRASPQALTATPDDLPDDSP